MRKKAVATYFLALLIPLILGSQTTTAKETDCEVFFSPKGDCTAIILKEIHRAKTSIFVMAYSFTSASIAKALLDAKKRDVKVEVVIDHSRDTEKYSETRFFKNMGIPVYVDSQEPIQHNKVMIIDGETVITGSFNFTRAAEEKNAENLLVIKSEDLARLYFENWVKHRNHSSGESKGSHVSSTLTHAANKQ